MSLILEALKKSEFRRRLGEAPNLDTPFTPARKRRNLLPVLLAAIAVAMALGWWLINRPVLAPATPNAAAPNATPAGTQPLTAIAPVPTAPVTSPDATRNAPVKPSVHEPVTVARSSAAERTPSVASFPAPGQPSANPGALIVPNPSLLKPPPKDSATAPATTKPEATQHEPEPPLADIANNDSEIARTAAMSATNGNPALLALAGQEATQGPTTATPPPMQPTHVPPPETNPTTTNAQTANPPLPTAKPGTDALPLYFQLPYSLRKDLPAIKVSMHVYAAEPAQRFAIINGARQIEGSTISTDLLLKEIRANELVLEFRGQRFIVPRSGT